MPAHLPLAAIGLDDILVGIVILVIVILRIARAASASQERQQRGPERGGEGAARPGADPQEELQRFLRTLAGEEQEKPAPRPPPPPRAATARPQRTAPSPRKDKPARQTPASHPQRPRTKMPATPAAPHIGSTAVTDLGARNAVRMARRRAELRRDLRRPESLRGAILLREVLGPPLALRPGPSSQGR